MNRIKFYTSTFFKFQNLNIGLPLKLIEVFIKDKDDLSDSFDCYENEYWDWKNNRKERLSFPNGDKVIILLFQGDSEFSQIFTVVRKYSEGSYKNYLLKRGEEFIMEFINNYKYDS